MTLAEQQLARHPAILSGRARRIVVLAAGPKPGRKGRMACYYPLFYDEGGFWELEAVRLLDLSAARAAHMGMGEADVDEATANHLALLCTEALLRQAERNKP
jgi:hypothetical protein